MSACHSKVAVAVSAGSLALACAIGESSKPGPASLDDGGSSGATAQAGNAALPVASAGAGGAGAGTGSVTAGTTFGSAGTDFGGGGGSPANAGGNANGPGNNSGGVAGSNDGGTAGTSTSSASAGSAGAGGMTPSECPVPQGAELPLPLTVSGNFIPSGYFASPAVNTAGIAQTPCEVRPAGHTIGDCYEFTFQASMLEGKSAYAGVFWQHGANNWGTAPGLKLAPGATKVTFKAWSASASGGELVEFSAGGIGGVGTPCADRVNLGQGHGTKVTLTKTPTQYTIDLQGQTYPQGVIGGFVWSAAVSSVDQVLAFYVDEIQWIR